MTRCLLTIAVLVCGAGWPAAAQSSDDPAAQDPDPSPPPISTHGSSQEGQGQLPAGHPPVTTPAGPSSVLPLPPPGSGTGASALTWTVPEGWVAETPSSAMRRAQYKVPGTGGDGQCVVYYFGPGQGGDAMLNAQRWAGQFVQPDGRPSTEVLKTEQLEVGGIPVLTVEVTGTYSGGMAMMSRPPQSLPDHMLLGVIAEGPDANWFFKLTGPEATLREQKPAFEALYGSLKRAGGD